MSAVINNIKLSGLSKRLVSDGLLDADTAIEAESFARQLQKSLVYYLVEDQAIDASRVALLSSELFGLPLLDLSALDMDDIPVGLVDEELINEHQVLPLGKRGNRLFVAIADPMNPTALDTIKFNAGIPVEPILVRADQLKHFIEDFMSSSDIASEEQIQVLDNNLDNLELVDEEQKVVEEETGEEKPVIRLVNKILLEAINKGASDIHFEPYEKFYRVRLRIDGILQETQRPPTALANKLTARVKVMSKLDISERRVPQDGRIKLKISKRRAIDFRVNSCPTLYGEKIVLRILDPSSAKLGIDALGYSPEQKNLYLNALASPYGMILVTGPTGSGKTVSLYTGLNILNTDYRNISTAEDPAEINMPGINQVNVNPKAGLDFAAALRAFLRQDPDVIMVGEIRDLETANIAIKAAQTGHLVLSTLHTNDAPQTLTRLINMGVPPFNIASAVTLIIAQRLARRLCKECCEPETLPAEALLDEGFTAEEIPTLKIYKAKGCSKCNEGYKGRMGIYQVMPITEAIAQIIMEGGNSLDIAKQAKAEGVLNLRDSALNAVRNGLVSLVEANRVTKD